MLTAPALKPGQEDHFFQTFEDLNYGDVHIKRCDDTGLIAIIAIHNTNLGPALGGCRFVPYPNFNAALIDALHLAQGMSFKSAISGLPHGGGKAVIMAPPKVLDRQALFLRFGEFVHELGGRYITAEDSGVSIADMDIVQTKTPFVTGTSSYSYKNQDPSPLTAIGVRRGIEAAVRFKLKRTSLENIHVAVQGLGKVGRDLCLELHQRGATLTVADIHEQSIHSLSEKIPVQVVSTDQIHKVDCDVYAPCALSFPINPTTIREIKAQIIAGSANNQLLTRDLGQLLWEKGVLYAPDYVINAGGLIQVSAQYAHSSEEEARTKVEGIYDTLMTIFEASKQQGLPTHVIADRIALERIHSKKSF